MNFWLKKVIKLAYTAIEFVDNALFFLASCYQYFLQYIQCVASPYVRIGKENILKAINNSSSMTRIPFRHISMYIYRRMGYEPNKCLFEMAFSILKYGINQPLSICKCACVHHSTFYYIFFILKSIGIFFLFISLLLCWIENVHKKYFFASSIRIFPYFQ